MSDSMGSRRTTWMIVLILGALLTVAGAANAGLAAMSAQARIPSMPTSNQQPPDPRT